MTKHLATTSILCLMLASPAFGQSATATGVGVGQSESNSAAGAVAVNRGNGNSNSSLVINNPANTTSTIVSNSRQEVSGTQTLKNVPTAFAPSLAAAGIETCLGSVSGGGSIVGFGGSFGTTVPDPGCQARLDARTLWSMGLKGAAVARLCIREDIYRSMPDVCEKYRPPGAVYPTSAPIIVPPNYGYPPSRVADASGPIEVVNGKTGRVGICDNYDGAAQKCHKWAGVAKPQKLAVKRPTPTPAAKPAEIAVVTP